MATGSYNQREVLRIVTAEGLRSRRTGKPLQPQSFKRLLQNPLYKGWIVTSMDEPRRGDFEPLVDETTFLLVQEILSGRRPHKTDYARQNPEFPLRRFIFCATCGRVLTGSRSRGRSKRYRYYQCQQNCKGIRMRANDLDEAFCAHLDALNCDPAFLPLFSEIVSDVWREVQAMNKNAKKQLQNRLAEIEKRVERLVEAFVFQQSIDRETYEGQKDHLTIQRAEIISEVSLLDEQLDPRQILDGANEVLADLAEFWKNADLELKQRLQTTVYPSGLPFDGKELGTAEIAPVFKFLRDFQISDERMVSPRGLVDLYQVEIWGETRRAA